MKKNHHGWIVDKHIPVAVIITILIQVGGMLVWAASLEARVNTVEQQTSGNVTHTEKLARIEERLEHMKQDTDAIKKQLGFITNRLMGK